MKIVTVKLPESYLEAIDRLVAAGRYSSRSEFIRAAIEMLLRQELREFEKRAKVKRQ